MTRKYINVLNSLIKRLSFGDHVEPVGSESHLDIRENEIGFNAYYDEVAGSWKSTNATANYLIRLVSNKLYLSSSDGNAVGSVITWSDSVSFDGNHTKLFKCSGLQRAQYDYTSTEVITPGESGANITNYGAIGDIVLTLPPIDTGYEGIFYNFHVRAAHELKIQPSGGDTMTKSGLGIAHMRSSFIGNCFMLTCTEQNKWIVEYIIGTWQTL